MLLKVYLFLFLLQFPLLALSILTARTEAQLTGKVDVEKLKPDNNAVVDGRTGNEDEKKKSKLVKCMHKKR